MLSSTGIRFRFRWLIGAALCVAFAGNALAIERTHVSTLKKVFPDSVGNIALSFDRESSFCGNANSPKQYFIAPGADGVTVDASKNMLAVALLCILHGGSADHYLQRRHH